MTPLEVFWTAVLTLVLAVFVCFLWDLLRLGRGAR